MGDLKVRQHCDAPEIPAHGIFHRSLKHHFFVTRFRLLAVLKSGALSGGPPHVDVSAAGTAPLPKELFGYEVVGRLGEGAASVLYVVSDRKTGQLYALKHVVRQDDKADPFFQQMETEMEVSRGFKHPVLRKCHELKINRTLLRKVMEMALIMELVDGVPLQTERPGDVARVVSCFIDVAKGLGALHYQRFVHCDLKPGNILMSGDGDVKLIDFGQAAKIGSVKERIQGTPDFIAPEQVKLKAVDERTDVFSFGASLYWTLTGKHTPTLFTVNKKDRDLLISQTYPRPIELNPEVSQKLSDLVMDCVRTDPAWRPSNMGEILARLEKV
jgi:serine/threonine-protein kinase